MNTNPTSALVYRLSPVQNGPHYDGSPLQWFRTLNGDVPAAWPSKEDSTEAVLQWVGPRPLLDD
ncbi:hypothetical protein GCM10008957_31490 [Deinococcus ruber]|uniref:Uncharacterized protein n=2 Tax=Deinococcus ruber TaxID=1848197 RepID=A0A918CCU2_9DEIO|nr:hypothetical protein GCM10008957_31490 [Deinococcus ruber]